jgi:hypothetical protein
MLTNKTLTIPLPLQLDTITIEDREEGIDAAARREGSAKGTASPPTSNHHEVSIRLNDAKMNMILTFPSSLRSLTIDIDKGEEVQRDQPRNCGSHPVKHQEVSFGCDIMQRTQNTYLPFISRARCN